MVHFGEVLHDCVISPPELKQLTIACKSVTEWYELGIQLDLSTSQLKDIEVTYKVNGMKRLRSEMFDAWLKSSPKATWGDLITALKNMNENRVASDIEAVHHSPTAGMEYIIVVDFVVSFLCALIFVGKGTCIHKN